jgi:hypothetical protein
MCDERHVWQQQGCGSLNSSAEVRVASSVPHWDSGRPWPLSHEPLVSMQLLRVVRPLDVAISPYLFTPRQLCGCKVSVENLDGNQMKRPPLLAYVVDGVCVCVCVCVPERMDHRTRQVKWQTARWERRLDDN